MSQTSMLMNVKEILLMSHGQDKDPCKVMICQPIISSPMIRLMKPMNLMREVNLLVDELKNKQEEIDVEYIKL